MTRFGPASSLSLAAFVLAPVLALSAGCDTDVPMDGDTDPGGSTGVEPPSGTESTGVDSECTLLAQEDIDGGATIPAGCYDVTAFLNVGAAVHLEAGAELRFGDFAGMFVLTGGELSSSGTAEAPVLLTASGESWAGIEMLGAATSGNQLEGTIIEGTTGTAISVNMGSRLGLTDCELRDNAGTGVVVSGDSQFTSAGTTYTQNALPLELWPANVEGIDASNTIENNTLDVVSVNAGNLAENATWSAAGVPYRILGNLSFDGALTLGAGVVIEMPLDSEFRVSTTGSVTAEGSADAQVVVRGVENERGFWKGLSVASKATANRLSYTAIENAGSSAWNGDSTTQAAIWLPDQSKLAVDNSVIRGSDGAALMAREGSDISGFASNTIENNARTLEITPNMPTALDGSNTFSDNDDGFIGVRFTFSKNGQLNDDTWPNTGIPYRILERFDILGDWVIEPGVEIQFAQDVSISVDPGGSIRAEGTADAPIRFVGSEQLTGYWKGIEIHSVSASNVLDNVEVRHAGSEGFNGADDSDGSFFIGGFGGDGTLTLRNSTIADSGGYGVVVWNDSQLLDCGSVSFEGNDKADVFVNVDGASSACGA